MLSTSVIKIASILNQQVAHPMKGNMNLSNVKKVFVVNLWGKSFNGFSKGELNNSFCALAEEFFKSKGCEIKRTDIAEEYNVEEELEKYKWADVVFYQSPTNWIGMPWEAKKWAEHCLVDLYPWARPCPLHLGLGLGVVPLASARIGQMCLHSEGQSRAVFVDRHSL